MAKGHNSIAQLCQVGFRGVIMDLNYHKNVELTARWRYDKKADKIGVIFGILINRFNFSFKRESWGRTGIIISLKLCKIYKFLEYIIVSTIFIIFSNLI